MKRIINKISKCAKKVSPTFHFPLFTLNFPTFHFPLSTFLLLTFHFLLFTFHFPLSTYSQSINYPVQVNTIIKPPYSLYLSDYSAPGNDLLTLQLLLKDLNEPEMQVRLRLEILGNNITIRTRDNYVPPPIILGGGIPEVLYSSDLANYFDVRNLDFQGYSEQEYIKSGKLPEGVYQISFTVYDYMYNRQISNKGLSIAWMMLNDPPIINTPRNHEKIRASDPQNIAFSWTPRHMGSPNSAFATEYEFTLVELWPENRNPNDAILSSMPIFQTTTMATSLYYGPAETALEPGRKYAFRVRAYDVEGRDLFKNQGYSEVYTFTYGDACLPPEGITGASPAEDRISIEWQQQMNHSGYKVQVRKANNDDAEWFTKSANINKAIVEGLEAGTLYEYRLISTCGTISGEPSEVFEVSTKEANPGNFACNVPSGDFDLENIQPLPGLFKGDVIDAGDFDVKVMESSGSNGRFTGSGSLVMPFMNNIRVQVDFNNIAVNTDYKMTDGSMKVVRGSVQLLDDAVYDAIDDAIATIDQIDTALAVSEEVAGVIHDYTTLDTLHTDGNVSSVYINDDGMIVVVDKEGNSTLHEPPPGGLLVEGAGVANGYVAKGGKVTHEAVYRQDKFAKNNLNADSLELPLVQFMAHPDQTYGFDTPDRRVPENYQVLVAGDKPHYIPWKAIKEGEEDKILVRVTGDKGFDPYKIEFRSASRTYTTTNARSEGKDRIYEITLTGGDPDTPEELYAIYPTDSAGLLLGKLNIRSYSEENKTVTLVRLKGSEGVLTDIEKIKSGLNDIFRQSVATWTVQEITVEVETTDWDINGDGLLEYGNSDFISTYTGEMKEFIRAFEDKHKVSMDDGYFVFLFPGEPDTNRKPDAFMPKKRQYAFMFTRYMTSNPIRTLAHELSHGAYRLSHPWELYQALQKGTTGNLMDYVDSTRLYQYQWNHIHNPPAMIGWMQDDVDGAAFSDHCEYAHLLIEEYRKAYVLKTKRKVKLPHEMDMFGGVELKLFDGNSTPMTLWSGEKAITEIIIDGTSKIDSHISEFKNGTLVYDLPGYWFKIYKEDQQRFENYLYPANESERLNQIIYGINKISSSISNEDLEYYLSAIPVDDYQYIDFEKRKISIEKLLSESVNESGPNDVNEEYILVNLFREFSSNESPDEFIKYLSTRKIDNVPLIRILISSVDNKYLNIGEDNRKQLMNELLQLFSKTQVYKKFIDELDSKLNSPTIDQDYAISLSKKTVAFDYKSIYARSLAYINPDFLSNDLYTTIDADINDEGRVLINSYLCYGFISLDIDNENPKNLDPFDPIIFDQKSTLGALEGFEKVFIAPAIFAYYADKEAGIKTAIDVTQTGIDIGTLFIPVGQLTKLGKLFFYADKISSITSLAAGFAETDENVKNVLSGISLVTGIVSIGENFVNPQKLLIKTENLSKSKSVLQSEFITLVADINKLSPKELKQIESVQGKLADFLEGYRKGLGLSENVTKSVVSKLENLAKAGNELLGSIVKNGNKIEYTNPAGKLLKWSEQSANDITNSINSAKNSADVGKKLEGTVADFIKGEGKTIEGFGVKINSETNQAITDIDIITSNEIVEVKNSYSAWSGKKEQVNRFVNALLEDFLNPYNKKAILYIQKPLSAFEKSNILNTIPNNVTLVNSLTELKTVLK